MNATQFQRDIQWILDCPDLLEGDVQHLRFENTPTFTAPPLKPTSHKVGRYFEQLVSVMLTHSTEHRLIEQSMQIIKDGRTLGELDFIYDGPDGKLTHCEVAIKYYLYCPQVNMTSSHFIGPNPRDTFENKVSRLLTHQIPLSHLHYPAAERRESFIKGGIFYPLGLTSAGSHPDYLSQDHYRGTWLFARDTAKLADYTNAVYCICRKPNWLAPSMDVEEFLSPRDIVEWTNNHFKQKPQPLMVSRLQEQQGQWIEQDRLFVVSDQWPNTEL